MRKRKIKTGWEAVPIKKEKFQNTKIPWVAKYEFKNLKEDGFFSKIIKFIIKISLFFSLDNKKNLSKTKKNVTIDITYNTLSSSQFKFIPAAVAFYLLLSIIPIIVIVLSIVNIISNSWNVFLVNQVLPRIIPGIQTLFSVNIPLNSANLILTFIFVFSSIWFASKGVNKFIDSFVEIYSYNDRQNFITKRIKSMLIVTFISIYFSIIAISFVPLVQLIMNNISNEIIYDFIFYLISFFYVFFFGYIGIGLLFKYISPFRIKWKYLNLGILTSLIPIVLFFLFFSTITKFLNYEKFGLVGSFLYLVIFILYISYFLHAGIVFNASYYRVNVLHNMVVKKTFISQKIVLIFKNLWHKIKYYKRS